jgi:hypothetical protein
MFIAPPFGFNYGQKFFRTKKKDVGSAHAQQKKLTCGDLSYQ